MAEEHHENEGHSVAAWTTVCFLLVASAVLCIGVAWGLHPLYYIGAALAVVGVIVGKILGKMGFGNPMHTDAPPLTAAEQAQLDAQQAS